MIIERIQVEGGFLDGLDLNFAKGLNVLIGSRGAGKTSVIELIRFCLGSKALTEEVALNSREHALSILGNGTVTVTITDGTESINLSRSAEQWTTTNSAAQFAAPVVISQNEIESLGLSAPGRLKLIDNVRPHVGSTMEQEGRLLSYVRSQTEERRSTHAELQTIRAQLAQLTEQLEEAEGLKKQHQDALSSIQKATGQTIRLQELDSSLAALSVRTAVFNRTLQGLQNWQMKLQTQAFTSIELETWPAAARSEEDPLVNVRQFATSALGSLQNAVTQIGFAIAEVELLSEQNAKQVLDYEAEARELRRQLEVLQKGAGETARKLAAIKERIGQQSALRELEKAKVERLKAIQAERKRHLDELENVRIERYLQRETVIKRLNVELGPQIRVAIERAGQNSEYASAIVAALRGSGIRTSDIIPLIADEMSPREFVEAVENEDVEAFVNATGLSEARAARIIERVNEQGVESILTASIEDGVTLYLLDGTDYKTTEQLSTGQRCTVVLPLLLKQHALSLIVDQPEDHLDNAFIVGTLIKAISQRKQNGQLIFATHNANIPVIGEADRIIEMSSDGSRGFVRHSGALDEKQSVTAITSLMEGGMEAFNRRAKFYHSN